LDEQVCKQQLINSAPLYAVVLERENAVLAWREFIGPTDPDVAREKAPHSIRAMFGTGGSHNAVHGSDSLESSAREILLVFGDTLDQVPAAEPVAPKEPPPQDKSPRRSVTTSLKKGGSRVASVQLLNEKAGKSFTPMGSTGSLAGKGKIGSSNLKAKSRVLGGSKASLLGSKASLR
jgi:hypothetical protein